MITVKITKCFHRDTLAFERGMTHEETMTFIDMNEADDWALRVNARHQDPDMPYHITNVYQDNGNWICLDISDIWDAAGDDFCAAYNRHNPR